MTPNSPVERPIPPPPGRDLWEHARSALSEQPYLPFPGKGQTLERWVQLSRLAAEDVCLVKVLEAHHDAAAVLAELKAPPVHTDELWGVWAAEAPGATLRAHGIEGERCLISGTKAWCSGASLVTHALLTVVAGDTRHLVAVHMGDPGISEPRVDWEAVGMRRIVSGPLTFDHTPARLVGAPGEYLARPGFWHGGAGIAACWFGAARAIAERLRTDPRAARNPHAAAHLGAIDIALTATASLLRETALLIDRAPHLPHDTEVTRVRCLAERVATDVIDRVARALGPSPLCEDSEHAERCADLTVFIRQCHAERDWENLGRQAYTLKDSPWLL